MHLNIGDLPLVEGQKHNHRLMSKNIKMTIKRQSNNTCWLPFTPPPPHCLKFGHRAFLFLNWFSFNLSLCFYAFADSLRRTQFYLYLSLIDFFTIKDSTPVAVKVLLQYFVWYRNIRSEVHSAVHFSTNSNKHYKTTAKTCIDLLCVLFAVNLGEKG